MAEATAAHTRNRSNPVKCESLPPASQTTSVAATELQEREYDKLLPTCALGTCELLPPLRTPGLGTCYFIYIPTVRGQ